MFRSSSACAIDPMPEGELTPFLPHSLKDESGLRAPGKKTSAAGRATGIVRPAERSHRARSAGGRKHRRLLRRLFDRAWESSAPAPSIARRGCAPACRSMRSPPVAAALAIRKWISWCGAWPGAVFWNTASRVRMKPATRSSSNRRMPDYWPQMPALGGADLIVLSRFAYLRRRGNEMILESPRAAALFRIGDPKLVCRPRSARHAAQHQQAAAAGRISRARASRVAGGLPDSVQDRRRRWRWPARQ